MTTMTLSMERTSTRWHNLIALVLLGASMFLTGATGLVAEYVLATVSTYILGNSIEQWSIIVAGTMFSMGIGSIAQKHVSDKNLIEKFILLEMGLSLIIGFAPISVFAAFSYMDTHFALVQYFFVGAVGFLIGFEIPLVSRILEPYVSSLKQNLSITFAWDYIGSFAGALVWVYFLLPNFPLSEISFIMVGSNLLVALATFLYFISLQKIEWKKSIAMTMLVVIGLLAYGLHGNRVWSDKLEYRLYDEPIVLAKTTKYQRLVVTQDKQIDDTRLYINGNLQFSSYDEARYHEPLVHPIMTLVPDHGRVLVLGGGDGLAMREILKYPGVTSATLVDLDPDMIQIAREDPTFRRLNHDSFRDARVTATISEGVGAGPTRRIMQSTDYETPHGKPVHEHIANAHIFTVDADRFLSVNHESQNVIIIDLPDPNSVELAKLYSREFYAKVRNTLSESGMVVVQSTSPYHAKESFLCVARTMEAAGLTTLAYHENVPSFGDWGWILGWRDGRSVEDVKRQIAAITEFSVDTRYLTPDVFRAELVFGKGMLDSVKTDVNTLMQPVLLRYYTHDSWQVE